MSTGGPRGEKPETVAKKRKVEKDKFDHLEKVQYTEKQRERAFAREGKCGLFSFRLLHI